MSPKLDKDDKLSLIFSALAHPARRSILSNLKDGKATVKELSKPLEMTAPAVTKHLKKLEHAGLIDRSKDAQWRFSKLDADPLKTVYDWLDDYKELWNKRIDRLEEYLGSLKQKEKNENE